LGEASLDEDTNPEVDVWTRKWSRSVIREVWLSASGVTEVT
jgi:hypothetical protein